MSNREDLTTLIEKAKSGDESARLRLFNRFEDKIRRGVVHQVKALGLYRHCSKDTYSLITRSVFEISLKYYTGSVTLVAIINRQTKFQTLKFFNEGHIKFQEGTRVSLHKAERVHDDALRDIFDAIVSDEHTLCRLADAIVKLAAYATHKEARALCALIRGQSDIIAGIEHGVSSTAIYKYRRSLLELAKVVEYLPWPPDPITWKEDRRATLAQYSSPPQDSARQQQSPQE